MCPWISKLVNSLYASGWFPTLKWTAFCGQLQMKLQFVSCGVFSSRGSAINEEEARGMNTQSRSHSLSDVRTKRNNAALHAAEIAVASPKAAEIE